METLSKTTWEIVLTDTGFPLSLLALALSRSGKKVLHLDRNDYYGGAEAALSLQDAEAWVKAINDVPGKRPFRNAHISKPREPDYTSSTSGQGSSKLSFSRAYSLSLSPQLIYTRSTLLPTLVASKAYQQLEFLAVGSWWVYNIDEMRDFETDGLKPERVKGKLKKIPGSKEDVFADKTIDLKSKRALMNFLRFAGNADAQEPVFNEWGNRPFGEFLLARYGLTLQLQSALHALTLSPHSMNRTKTSYALPRICRHLTSIGVFGPGFGSVIPKWGGLAEIAQVACRAGAVGGGVYVLNKGIRDINSLQRRGLNQDECGRNEEVEASPVRLQDGEEIRASWIAGSHDDLFPSTTGLNDIDLLYMSRMISIVSSPLSGLFPITAEGSPSPAGTVVVFPTDAISDQSSLSSTEIPPIYFMIHSSETGECPTDQCVVYSSVHLPRETGYKVLELAIQRLLETIEEEPRPHVLWSLQYSQQSVNVQDAKEETIEVEPSAASGVLLLPDIGSDLVFDDSILEHVRNAWQKVTGLSEGFMQFEDREQDAVDYDDDGY